jgi:glycosyltransferase involved in cell wall biosynthesis
MLALSLRDFRRDPTPNRGRRFGQAAVLAAELPESVDWVHVHYLHTPASVGRYTALLRGLPYSLSAHAKDVWTIPDWEKREKLAGGHWTVTCSRMNHEHLRVLAPDADVELLYHGLEADRFPGPNRGRGSDGHDPAKPVIIVSVARAVEKKGLDLLLAALAHLPAELHWRFVHVGGGPLTKALGEEAARLAIADRVRWLGAATQAEVVATLRDGEIFCLPSRIAADGDRDGLPNVIMEAMSQELAVVATAVAAIPEVVVHGQTGLLVPAEAVAELSEALVGLIRDPDRRLAMGQAGRRRILEHFAFERGIARLAARFGLPLPSREAA